MNRTILSIVFAFALFGEPVPTQLMRQVEKLMPVDGGEPLTKLASLKIDKKVIASCADYFMAWQDTDDPEVYIVFQFSKYDPELKEVVEVRPSVSVKTLQIRSAGEWDAPRVKFLKPYQTGQMWFELQLSPKDLERSKACLTDATHVNQ